MFWDYIIFSVGSPLQKDDIELQLSVWPAIYEYCRKFLVVSDIGEVRIGSGGATISILDSFISERKENKVDFSELKVMIMHTGGLSQRLPHVSCYGKIFTTFAGGETALEVKLRHYSKMNDLPPGVFISASDVFEDMSAYKKEDITDNCDVILFANQNDLQTASGHGVFVLDEDDKLRFVLQKPTIEEMRQEGAVRGDGMALTDCVYWMNWTMCEQLTTLRSKLELLSEICCYGDFMRPLGYMPRLEYLYEGSENLQAWRQSLAIIFSKCKAKVIDLGEDSFYHFGTPREFLSHIQVNSMYRRKMCSIANITGSVLSRVRKIGANSYIEYSQIPNIEIGQNCIISGLSSTRDGNIPNNLIVFTIAILDGTYATAAFDIQDDIKERKIDLRWMGKSTGLKNTSLWEARLFSKQDSQERSLSTTLSMIHTGFKNIDKEFTSLAEINKWKHIEKQMKNRAYCT